MIERLFFNGIDAKTAGPPIGEQDDLATDVAPHETQASLAFMQFAKAWTDGALDATVVQFAPVTSGKTLGRIDDRIHDGTPCWM
jgi:hypothetical protein